MKALATKGVSLVAMLTAFMAVILFGVSADASLVAYYSFDGDDATDLSEYGNDGIVGSALTFDTSTPFGSGKSVYSPYVANSTGVISVPTSASLQSIGNAVTISFWMNAGMDSPAWGRIMQHANEGQGTQGWMINNYYGNNELNLRVDTLPGDLPDAWNQNIAISGDAPFTNEWHHLVFMLENGNWTKYFDTVKSTGTYRHGAGFSNTRPLYICGRNNYGNYKGLIDDVAIWNEPLEDWAVEALFNGVSPLSIPEPSSLALLVLGSLGLAVSARRRVRR